MALQKFQKWRTPSHNLAVGAIVVTREEGMVPTRWPLERVVRTHPGGDDVVRVVTVRCGSGTYTRPVQKLVLLLPQDS